ncbi:hypothetical protein [Evansella clarkii]|uniref:hypothetical protein n=1 Tax=Evansella clarkii TaxID=79879 RepID=UPI000B43F5E6|nr:hypothetical protein [Evansella clarkii]
MEKNSVVLEKYYLEQKLREGKPFTNEDLQAAERVARSMSSVQTVGLYKTIKDRIENRYQGDENNV